MFEQRPEEVRERARWTRGKLTQTEGQCGLQPPEKIGGAFEEELGGGVSGMGGQGEDEELRPEQGWGGQAVVPRKILLSTFRELIMSFSLSRTLGGEYDYYPQCPGGKPRNGEVTSFPTGPARSLHA